MSSFEELDPQLRAQLAPLLSAELKRMNGEEADASLLDCKYHTGTRTQSARALD